MPNASKTDFNEIDQTFSPANVPVGISAVIGVFKRGKINDPSDVINSWPQFQKLFGGLDQSTDDALVVKRAIERGSQARVVNLRHYTDPSDIDTLTATKATPANNKQVGLNAVLVVGNTLAVTINTFVVSQVFATSNDNTFNLLVAKIQQTANLAGIVQTVQYLGGNKMIITPKTGVVLAVSATVTGGASQAVVTIGTIAAFAGSTGATLFVLSPKNPGADYNNLQVYVQNASNGNANYFDLVIDHTVESSLLKETYKNLQIVGAPTVSQSSYLQAVTNQSGLMDVTYNDLSAIAAPIRPVNMVIKYDSAVDGGAVVDTDILGDSGAKTGVYALDPYDDFFRLASVNSNSTAVMQALATYATNRQDCVAFLHIDQDVNNTESEAAAARDTTLIDSTYVAFYTGGLIVVDPTTALNREISEIGDVLGAAAYSAAQFGPWWSFAGTKRGIINNAIGVVNNFGLDSNYNGRNLLANHQVNIVGSKSGRSLIMGNFTGQLDDSDLSFLNIRNMLLYLKRQLAPIFNDSIEEPNDPTTWLTLYKKSKVVLTTLQSKRAIVKGTQGWSYQGDQFATDPSQYKVNDPTDVDAGKYVVNLFVKPINSLQDIEVNIILTNSGVSFEDTLGNIGTSANQ